MKKSILSLAIILSFAASTFAQDGDRQRNREESRKRIEASKVAYMTTYLDLSSEEAAKFWPVYNEYQAELKALRGNRGERKKTSELSEAEATEKLNQYITMSSKKAGITEKYIAKFRTILSDKRVLMLLKSEGDFKKQMVKRYAEHKRGKSKEHRK